MKKTCADCLKTFETADSIGSNAGMCQECYERHCADMFWESQLLKTTQEEDDE